MSVPPIAYRRRSIIHHIPHASTPQPRWSYVSTLYRESPAYQNPISVPKPWHMSALHTAYRRRRSIGRQVPVGRQSLHLANDWGRHTLSQYAHRPVGMRYLSTAHHVARLDISVPHTAFLLSLLSLSPPFPPFRIPLPTKPLTPLKHLPRNSHNPNLQRSSPFSGSIASRTLNPEP